MGNMKKVNKGLGAVAAVALIAGGTSQVANAATNKGDLSNLKTEVIQKNKNIRTSLALDKNLLSVKEGIPKIDKEGLYEVNVKTLKEKEDSKSMAGSYLEKVNYEIKDGNKFLIFLLNRTDWMKNISVTVDGKEITPKVKETEKNDKGETKGKIKFKVSSLDSKVMLHMNVVPMGNARVAFRVIPEKGTVKLVKEYKKEVLNTPPTLTVGQDLEVKEGTIVDLMKGVTAQDKEDGDLTKNISVESGKLDIKNPKAGTYGVTYSVTDSKGEKVTQKRKVIVKASEKDQNKEDKENKDKEQGNNKDEQEVRIKTLPNVKSSRYGEIYGRLEYEIMVQDSKYINIVDYTRSISEVTVNGVKYQRDFSLGINKYYFGLSGALELNEDEFTKEVNKIVLKSNKYNTMIINVKKDGTLVDSKEVKSEKNKINTPPMLEVGNPLKIELGNKVDLMEGVSAIDEEDGEITKNIKIDCGKLNVDNPIKGIYNVTYSITDKKGETVTKTREIQITGKEVSVDNLEDGVYTLNFTARRIDDETRSSMLEDFFDRNIKVTVKNGKIVLDMLNTMHANTLYDLRIESNNKFNKTTSKYYGQPNPKDGSYKMQIFGVPMDSLKGSHVGGVLVGMMGGYKTQIGNMDNYTKVKFIFSDKCTKGWDGFITKEDKPNYDENLNKALLKLELDKNKDGNVSNEEIALAEGVISLSQKELKDISKLKYMGNKVTSLQLNGNYIETLPQGIFDNLTELKELTINSNLVQSLDEHIFDKLTKLEYLTIDSNKLSTLPENIFSKLVNLKTIGFTGNQLQELPDNLFHNNNKLEELYLGNNKLKALPKSLNTLSKLKSLHLENNDLTILPIEFKNLYSLEKLNISNNKVTDIPKEVYKKLNKLKELDLSDNKLTHIPSDIENIMPNLKRLNIKLNNIVDIPKTNINNYEYAPQKNVLKLKLEAKDGKLSWNQELSSLDVLCWTRIMNGINEESPKNIDEYKRSLNGKTARELLTGKVDWKIETELQKKNSQGQYVTLNKTAEEVKDDILSGQFNDPHMDKDDKYRIIKTVKSIGAAEEIVFSEIAYTSIKPVEKPAIEGKEKEEKQNKEKQVKDKEKEHEETKENIKFKALKEKNNEPSMAGEYVNKTVKYTEKNGKKYFTVTLNRMDWMKNVAIEVGGKEVDAEKNVNGNVGEFTFEVDSENTEVMMRMNVVPMGNARVAFRLVSEAIAPKPQEKPEIQDKEDKEKEQEQDKEKEQGKDKEKEQGKDKEKAIINIEKPAVYEAQVMINTTDKENEKAIKRYLNVDEKINIEVKDKQAYMTLKLKAQQKDIRAIKVDGDKVKEFEIIGEEVVKVNRLAALNEVVKPKVEENEGSTTVRFKIPNEKAKVEITMHNEAENKDETFAIKLKEDTVKEVKDNSKPQITPEVKPNTNTGTSHKHSHKHKKHKKDDNNEQVKDNKEDKKDDTTASKDTNIKEDGNDAKPSTDVKDNNKKDDSSKDNKDTKKDKKDSSSTEKKDPEDSKEKNVEDKKDVSEEVKTENKNAQKQNKVTSQKEKSSTTKKTESKSNKKAAEIKEKKLPQTGMPFGSGLLATIGSAISGLGVVLGRKNKKNKK